MSSSTSSSSHDGNALDATPVAAWATRRFVLRALLWPTVAVLVLELACRVFSPIYLENPDPRTIEVEAPGYRALRPGASIPANVGGKALTAQVNADGFRDVPFPAETPCLVVGIGNSFVANWAIEQADFWTTQLQRRLTRGPEPQRCAVRSVGFQGWSLPEIDAALADRVLPRHPKLVVLAFNNLTMWTATALDPKRNDEAIARWHARPHPTPEPVPQAEPTALGRVIGLYNQLEAHSALLGTLKVHAPLLPMTVGLSQLAVSAIYRDAEFAARKAPTLASLEVIRARVTAAGAQFVLLVVPTLPETDEDVYDLMLASFGGSERDVNIHRPAATLAAWAQEKGVTFVDLTPVLHGHRPRAMGYVDHHWNEVGNAVAAEELEPVVRRLVPER